MYKLYMDTCIHLHGYMFVHTHFIWKPKLHWQRKKLTAARLVCLVAEAIEDKQQ